MKRSLSQLHAISYAYAEKKEDKAGDKLEKWIFKKDGIVCNGIQLRRRAGYRGTYYQATRFLRDRARRNGWEEVEVEL